MLTTVIMLLQPCFYYKRFCKTLFLLVIIFLQPCFYYCYLSHGYTSHSVQPFCFCSGHWVCGGSCLAIRDSLTHQPSPQGWESSVLCFVFLFCICVYTFDCVSLGAVDVLPVPFFPNILYNYRLVCYIFMRYTREVRGM